MLFQSIAAGSWESRRHLPLRLRCRFRSPVGSLGSLLFVFSQSVCFYRVWPLMVFRWGVGLTVPLFLSSQSVHRFVFEGPGGYQLGPLLMLSSDVDPGPLFFMEVVM